MARPKSDDKRLAILDAAARSIAMQGLSAPTAAIAKQAGISTGSLFTYFPTKSELLNQLYVDLKVEMATAAIDGLPLEEDPRAQLWHMWCGWISWASSAPDQRRALAILSVSDGISEQSRTIGQQAMAGVSGLLDRSRKDGPMCSAPLSFVATLLSAVAEATVDFILRDAADADAHCKAGFEAMWRMIA